MNITEDFKNREDKWQEKRSMLDITRDALREVNKSVKYDNDKPDYTLLDPLAIEEMVKVLDYGAQKYKRDNWRTTGFSYTRLLSACMRHLFAFLRGEDLDPESGRSHLAHAMCCLMFLLNQVLINKKELDDRFINKKDIQNYNLTKEQLIKLAQHTKTMELKYHTISPLAIVEDYLKILK